MKAKGQRIEKVAVVKCQSYKQAEVDKAVRKALKLIKFINLEKIAPSPIFWGTKSIYKIK